MFPLFDFDGRDCEIVLALGNSFPSFITVRNAVTLLGIHSLNLLSVAMFPSKSDLNQWEMRIKRNSNHVCFHQKHELW